MWKILRISIKSIVAMNIIIRQSSRDGKDGKPLEYKG